MWQLAARRRYYQRGKLSKFLILLPTVLVGLTACGSRSDIAPGPAYGGFSVDPQSCVASHPAGIEIELFDARREALRLTVAIGQAGQLRLMTGDRPVLITPLAPVATRAGVSFDDAAVFWAAFGQADRLVAADIDIAVADQAALRNAMAACTLANGATQ